MKTIAEKLALVASATTFIAGCYIGRANFEGENMHLYTPWNTISTSASADVK